MKILKINKSIDINLLKDGLSNYEFGDFDLGRNHKVLDTEKVVLAKFRIGTDSKLAKHNINHINDDLCIDEESIEYIIEHYYDTDNITENLMPGLFYKYFLSYGIEYSTKMVNGKVVREVKQSEYLDKAVTEYYISIWPDIWNETSESYLELVLEPVSSFAGKLIFDYETINNYIPDFLNRLIELGYVEVKENGHEIDSELQGIIDYING